MDRLKKALKRTGELALAAALLFAIRGVGVARADDVHFTAEVPQTEISLDDSVPLKLTLSSAGGASVGAPGFHAPNFDVINQYTSNYVESRYENGRFVVNNRQELTEVLKPLKKGTLKITGIHILVNGKTLTAPDITIQVGAAGPGTPPPRGYGGSGVGLRGAQKRGSNAPVLLRAEVDKRKVYKGEQVIVSYYLYRRVRVFNIQVDKYPSLNGFLREDLEMPVLGQRLDSERVVMDGVPYERSLLVRYAAYPLQAGKLQIDPISLKYNYYYDRSGSNDDDDDPFLNFFQQFAPRPGSGESEPFTIDVAPLPEQGKPASFTGGVGDFTVSSAVDKYEVHANEAVTVTVKVEGRGNVAAVGEPKAKWPDGVELYDSKGKSQTGRGGVGQKVFEFLLIPRNPGPVVLPPIEFSFFDPVRKQFVTKSTDSIRLNVLDPLPGSGLVRLKPPAQPIVPGGPSPQGPEEELHYLKAPRAAAPGGVIQRVPFWRWLYWLSSVCFLFLGGWVLSDFARRNRKKAETARSERARKYSRSWDALRTAADAATRGAAWQDVIVAYDKLASVVLDALDGWYDVGARSLARADLERLLVEERGFPEALWKRAARLLEYAETVRFATTAGAVSEANARKELAKWVNEGQDLVDSITRLPQKPH